MCKSYVVVDFDDINTGDDISVRDTYNDNTLLRIYGGRVVMRTDDRIVLKKRGTFFTVFREDADRDSIRFTLMVPEPSGEYDVQEFG